MLILWKALYDSSSEESSEASLDFVDNLQDQIYLMLWKARQSE